MPGKGIPGCAVRRPNQTLARIQAAAFEFVAHPEALPGFIARKAADGFSTCGDFWRESGPRILFGERDHPWD